MKILLDDVSFRDFLFPFGQLKSIAHLRPGILSIYEKWDAVFPGNVYLVSEHLVEENNCLSFPANAIPSISFLLKLTQSGNDNFSLERIAFEGKIFKYPWQLPSINSWAIREDFNLITKDRKSITLSTDCVIYNAQNIFIEPGAKVYASTINAEAGPVYIGKNALVMEGVCMRGPISIGEGAVIKMGAHLYEGTSIGKNCIAGGEIKNSILMDYSNKAHDGYLGDSVIGEWCNIGAGSSNSNLKNNAEPVKYWSVADNAFVTSGIKGGLVMGDFSRCAINTSFNTATLTGISCNIFDQGFPPKFVDNFSWGDQKYEIDRVIRDINNWKKLKDQFLSEETIYQLKKIYK
ncbi:MAG: putative sugar nucleotidyl transferase [Ginsengibacter sp.]